MLVCTCMHVFVYISLYLRLFFLYSWLTIDAFKTERRSRDRGRANQVSFDAELLVERSRNWSDDSWLWDALRGPSLRKVFWEVTNTDTTCGIAHRVGLLFSSICVININAIMARILWIVGGRGLGVGAACILACVHTWLLAWLLVCLHACVRACLHACWRACVGPCLRASDPRPLQNHRFLFFDLSWSMFMQSLFGSGKHMRVHTHQKRMHDGRRGQIGTSSIDHKSFHNSAPGCPRRCMLCDNQWTDRPRSDLKSCMFTLSICSVWWCLDLSCMHAQTYSSQSFGVRKSSSKPSWTDGNFIHAKSEFLELLQNRIILPRASLSRIDLVQVSLACVQRSEDLWGKHVKCEVQGSRGASTPHDTMKHHETPWNTLLWKLSHFIKFTNKYVLWYDVTIY